MANLPEKTFYFETIRLAQSDFDCHGNIFPKRVAELMQDVATAHAEVLGIGWDALREKGVLWVLSKLKIRFAQRVTDKCTALTLYTWPTKANRFFAGRDFCALDEKGQTLFCATTAWSLLDFNLRKMVSVQTLPQYYTMECSDAVAELDHDFTRVRREESFELCHVHTVRYADIDRNMHVNNTNYINFALNCCGTERGDLKEAEIVYHSECRLGSEISLYKQSEENADYIVGERNGTVCFTAAFKW